MIYFVLQHSSWIIQYVKFDIRYISLLVNFGNVNRERIREYGKGEDYRARL